MASQGSHSTRRSAFNSWLALSLVAATVHKKMRKALKALKILIVCVCKSWLRVALL
jgi:hypothetical protein